MPAYCWYWNKNEKMALSPIELEGLAMQCIWQCAENPELSTANCIHFSFTAYLNNPCDFMVLASNTAQFTLPVSEALRHALGKRQTSSLLINVREAMLQFYTGGYWFSSAFVSTVACLWHQCCSFLGSYWHSSSNIYAG